MLAANRKGCLFILVVATYLVFDFTEPFLPGAWSFEPSQSVDSTSSGHHAASLLNMAVLTACPQRQSLTETRSVGAQRRAIPTVTTWIAVIREAHSSSSDPAPLVEDH